MKKSPFPGMDPWLESRWSDVHTKLTTYACDQIQPQLPSGLHAHVEEYVSVESPDDLDRPLRFEPDVGVIERAKQTNGGSGSSAATTIAAEPLVVPLHSDPETLRYIRIVDAGSRENLVTTIEFLSLANKSSKEGRRQFQEKQKAMKSGGVNLVEIDLLRAGSWAMSVAKPMAPKAYRAPYRICVVRATEPHRGEIYATSLRQPLPTLNVPLRPDDDDIPLDLQTLVEAAYINGGYARYLDYKQDPQPPLDKADNEWADALLRERQLR